MAELNDIQRSLPSHPFRGSTIIYLTVVPVLLFYGKIKEFCLLTMGLVPRHIYSDKSSSCAVNLLVSSSHRNCGMRDCWDCMIQVVAGRGVLEQWQIFTQVWFKYIFLGCFYLISWTLDHALVQICHPPQNHNILLKGSFPHLEPGWTHLPLLFTLDAINGSAWAVLTLLLLSFSWILRLLFTTAKSYFLLSS